MSTIEEKIEGIVAAWNHRPTETMNRLYIGGLAAARVCRLLGVEYGKPFNIEETLRSVNVATIDAVFDYLRPYIDNAKNNPLKTCPTCGRRY